MKPLPFAYHAPATLDEALALMAEYGGEARPLAGGQSLVPAMNFRLAEPAVLIDLNGIDALFFLREDETGSLRIGAMARQRTVERSALVAARAPLLHAALPWVAHAQIRNRGTLGGSLAHDDPAAELPAVALALGARFHLQSQAGDRWVNADDFFLGLFTTALEPDELLVEIELPAMPPGSGWAFAEVARRHGDYALAGVAATVALDDDGACREARLAFFGVGDGPLRAASAEKYLLNEAPTEEALRTAAATAAHDDLDPHSDLHASAPYRRHLAEVLARRVLKQAFERAAAG